MTAATRRRFLGLACSAAVTLSAQPLFGEAAPFLEYSVGTQDTPLLDIRGDGTVYFRGKDGTTQTAPDALSNADVNHLRTKLLNDWQFLDIQASDILRDIDTLAATSNRIFSVADGGVSRISLHHAAGVHTVEFHGTYIAASTFPEIDALQRLAATEQALLRILGDLQR